MTDLPAHRELLPSLGRLVRGLSALFWGMPIALVVCFHTARSDSFKTMGIVPPMFCTAWLVYGLWQMGAFQPQERVWRRALDRSRLLALLVFGLSPFCYWWNRMPTNFFFYVMMAVAALSALFLLLSLNFLLQRLGAMLPDEGLRLEIRQFTAVNLNLLAAMILLATLSLVLTNIPSRGMPLWLFNTRIIVDRASLYFLIPLLLLPLAMTMAMLWKTKEVILDGVFGRK